MSKPFGIIYRAVNTITGCNYVGQTRQGLRKRKKDHKYEAGKRLRDNRTDNYFYNAINKYGWNAFVWKIVVHCDSLSQMNTQESFYIEYYREHGGVYNLTCGGNNHMPGPETCARIRDAAKNRPPVSPESRARMSAAQKNRTPEMQARMNATHKGVRHTEETKARISSTCKGKKKTPEHAANISRGKMGHEVTPETRAKLVVAQTGKVMPPGTGAKISASNKGKKRYPETCARISAAKKKTIPTIENNA